MTTFTFIQPHLRFGGAERQTVTVLNRLAERGHACHLVLHNAEGGLLGELSDQVQVHSLGTTAHGLTPLVAWRLRRVLRAIPPSYVVVKLWSSILAMAMVDRGHGHVVNYCEDLDPADHAEYIRFGGLKQRIVGMIFRRTPVLTANTRSVAAAMVPQYGLSEAPAVVPSTVDLDTIRRQAAADPQTFERRVPGEVQLISVGSLIERKGLRVTLEALTRIDRPLAWHVVGVGPLEQELRDFTDPRGLLRVVVHGGLPLPYSHMAAADLLVHAAESEAFGIVIPEAIAVGTPVLAKRAIGPSEMVRVLGEKPEVLALADLGDARLFADAISWRLETLDLAGAGSRVDPAMADRYLAPYSLEAAVQEWERRAMSLEQCMVAQEVTA